MDFYDFVPVVSQNPESANVRGLPKLIALRSQLEANLSLAKSKKTKLALSRQINELTRQIQDLERVKKKMDLEAEKSQDEKPKTDDIPGGSMSDSVLETKPVNVEDKTKKDSVIEPKKDSTLQPPQPQAEKKPNYLLWGGVAVVAIIGVILLTRNK